MESNYSIIICAKRNSKRFPGKSYCSYKNKPLFSHTFDFVDKLKAPVYLFTDDPKMMEEGSKRNYAIITDPGGWGDDPKMDMMRYIHEKIRGFVYVMLPLTSPNRDMITFYKSLWDFIGSDYKSATALKRMDKHNFKLSGAFWFFRWQQFYTENVLDDLTKFYIMDSLDIDRPEDLKE